MAAKSIKSQMTWGMASLAVAAAAAYLGFATTASIQIPTARDWVKREPAVPVSKTLPKAATAYALKPAVTPLTIPRVLVADIPSDLVTLTNVQARKQLFIRTVLPLIVEVNDLIMADRSRLVALKAQYDSGRTLSGRDTAWLASLMQDYRVKTLDWDLLLRRVDTVPPSLAIAQAATESAWGTSRFAQEGNALFGQWMWSDDGMIPEDRAEDAIHSVRRFATPLASVMAYARNLNTHDFYQRFRALRDELRGTGENRPGFVLASTLDGYSERRDAYVEELRKIIASNNLQALNTARFGKPGDQIALNDAR